MTTNTLEIHFHSVIDVITNSSTELFVTASSGAVTHMTELIQNILSAAGSDKKAEDIFNIAMVPNEEVLDSHYYDEECYRDYGYFQAPQRLSVSLKAGDITDINDSVWDMLRQIMTPIEICNE